MADSNGTEKVWNMKEFLHNGEKAVLVPALCVLVLLGIFANVLVVYAITSSARYSQVPSNIFLLNQSIANLGNAVSTICYLFHVFLWSWQVTYCLLTLTLFSSLGSVCLLTVNRLASIVWPLKYPKKMTVVRAKFFVAFVWIAALMITVLHLLSFLLYSHGNFFNYGRYYMIVLMSVFLSSNLYIYRKARQQSRKVRQMRDVVTGQQRNLGEDLRAMKTVGLVSLTFLIGWLPLLFIFVLYGSEKEDEEFQRYAAFCSPSTVLNVISDPLIYFFRSPEFRLFYQRYKRRLGVLAPVGPGSNVGNRTRSFSTRRKF